MKKAMAMLVMAVAISAGAVRASRQAAAQAQVDDLNAVTDASIRTHLEALLRGQRVEAARASPAHLRVASR